MRNVGPRKFLLLSFLSFFLATGAVSLSAKAQQQDPANPPLLANIERELKGGETHSYRVSLKAEQFLHADVEQKGIDLIVAVFGPDGKQITESDSPNDRWGPEPVLLIAENSG